MYVDYIILPSIKKFDDICPTNIKLTQNIKKKSKNKKLKK